MLARFAEEVHSAGHLDQTRHPVSRRHQRVDPFDRGDARTARRVTPLVFYFRKPCAQTRNQLSPARTHLERIRDALHVGEYVVEAVRRQRNYLRWCAEPLGHRGFDVTLAHRAYFALRLRDDHVGPQLAQPGRIDAIDRQRVANNLLHALIDFRTAAFGIELRFRQRWHAHDLGRKVAFMRAPDQLIFEAERADYLGRTRQQGY